MERFHFYEAELYRVLNLLVDLILQGHSYEPLRPQKRGVCKNPVPYAAFMLAWLGWFYWLFWASSFCVVWVFWVVCFALPSCPEASNLMPRPFQISIRTTRTNRAAYSTVWLKKTALFHLTYLLGLVV